MTMQDHQLDDRLNRGYKSATKYMNSFTSPLLEIVAKHVAFIASSILAVLILLTVYDEDVITVEHVITIITALGAVIAMSRAFIADVIPQKHSQTELYTQILEHVHYIPTGYPAYSVNARSFVATLFPYRITTLMESLISPIATPIILAFCLPSRSEQIIDFFRICTKEVPGTGDVCNFAMFNVRDQGNEVWKPAGSSTGPDAAGGCANRQQLDHHVIKMKAEDTALDKGGQDVCIPQNLLHTEDGKLELSLIHFKLTNPKWQPSEAAQDQFIDFVTKESIREVPEYEEGIESSSRILQDEERDPISSLTSSLHLPPHSRPSSRFHQNRPHSQQQQYHSSASMQRSSLNLHSLAQPPPQDRDMEVNEILNRERNRVLNSLHSDHSRQSTTSSRLDSNLCMTLSTLFLHEYAGSASHHGTGTSSCLQQPQSSQQPQHQQHQREATTETGNSQQPVPGSLSHEASLHRRGSGYAE